MELIEVEIGRGDVKRVKSPEQCIYCATSVPPLTDEHVLPYALAGNSLILEKSCCVDCQRIIQPYEQEVLKKQLGDFRAQVDAPTRNRKSRPTSFSYEFVEVDDEARPIRALGSRHVGLEDAPLAIPLWTSPAPRLLRGTEPHVSDIGQPWTYVEMERATKLARLVAEEASANHVAIKVGEVNRLHYYRALAKTAHAYACATCGPGTFEPMLLDIILNRSDDVAKFVGDSYLDASVAAHEADTMQVVLGEATDGPGKGLMVARIQLYPSLASPAHLVVVGKAKDAFKAR